MPKLSNLVGILAISAALTSGAVALGAAVTTASADAATVMGGFVGGPGPYGNWNDNWNRNRNKQRQGQKGKNHNKNKNKNKTKQWQHERQMQGQHQFLLRDFTLVLTPFQKTDSDSRALPYNWQYGQSYALPWNHQLGTANQQNLPRERQTTGVLPSQRQASDVAPLQGQRAEADPRVRTNNVAPQPMRQRVNGELEGPEQNNNNGDGAAAG
ncbi:hypothetical protein ACFHYQ_25905 [Sphaerimonospora cavernae]|uniref:Uncharacterized protein n=1 Tax=Sphaerimonospora cavernae TaxID=1740611 RepID=A0ABV6UC36_9ACTN